MAHLAEADRLRLIAAEPAAKVIHELIHDLGTSRLSGLTSPISRASSMSSACASEVPGLVSTRTGKASA
jgi:hypothetical protein